MTEEIVQSEQTNIAVLDEFSPMETVPDIALPTLEDSTEAKVMEDIRKVFRGFTYDSVDDVKGQFNDIDAFANYYRASNHDISEINNRTTANMLLNNAASVARQWVLCDVIRRIMDSGSYGKNVRGELAAKLDFSPSYIYKLRAVAAKITSVQAYLLGMRGVSLRGLTDLAENVKDDNKRNIIIQTFINSVTNTANIQENKAALDAFRRAIVSESKAMDMPELATSDPMHGGTETEVSPEYTLMKQQIAKWQAALKRCFKEENVQEMCNAAEQFFMHESTNDAQTYLDEVKDEAESLKAAVLAAINDLSDIRDQLISIDAVQVTDSDGNPVNAQTTER